MAPLPHRLNDACFLIPSLSIFSVQLASIERSRLALVPVAVMATDKRPQYLFRTLVSLLSAEVVGLIMR